MGARAAAESGALSVAAGVCATGAGPAQGTKMATNRCVLFVATATASWLVLILVLLLVLVLLVQDVR